MHRPKKKSIEGTAAKESKRPSRKVAQLSETQVALIGVIRTSGATAANIATNTFSKVTLDRMAIAYNANLKGLANRRGNKKEYLDFARLLIGPQIWKWKVTV